MSSMEAWHGTLKKVYFNEGEEPLEDEDYGTVQFKVKDQWYLVNWASQLDECGFTITDTDRNDLGETYFVALWYNGGGSIEEVLAAKVLRDLND